LILFKKQDIYPNAKLKILFIFHKYRGPSEMQVYPQDFKDDFEDDVLEEYGNIIGNKGQATSPQDQKLANTLRNSNFKNLTPRIHWPMREIKPISEFGNTKLFCLAFPWLFPGGIGDIKESRLYELDVSDWAQNLLFYQDGRFASDKLWCFFYFELHLQKKELQSKSMVCKRIHRK